MLLGMKASFKIDGSDVVWRAAVPRAIHVLRERSKAFGGDGSDGAALEVLREKCGADEWVEALENIDGWDNAGLANSLLGDAMDAVLPNSGAHFIAINVEELWSTVHDTVESLHQEFGKSSAAERFFLDAVRAALREDGAETLRLVRAAMAEWRGLS